MKVLILAIFPVGFFLLGFFIAKLQQHPDPDVRHLHLAENLIDELSLMAGEHQQYGDSLAPLALEKIVDYRIERNRI